MKKYNISLFLITVLLLLCVSCSNLQKNEYVDLDGVAVGDKVSSISILKEGDDPYELTFEEVINLMDKYVKIKGENYERGTNEYVDYLINVAIQDKEVQALREWPAILVFCDYYNQDDKIENYDLDDNKLHVTMTGKTIREFCKENSNIKPEKAYKDSMEYWFK